MVANQPYPEPPSTTPQQGNGMAVAGMVCGIIALVLCWIWFLAAVLGILAIIFGAIGLSRANKLGGRGKGMGIAGIVCGALGMILAVVIVFLVVKAFTDYADRARDSSNAMLTKVAVDKIASDWYNRWQIDSNVACPTDLMELARAVRASEEDLADPWGNPYKFVCGSDAGLPDGLTFGVMSLGEDEKEGTGDDIKSWERFRR